MPTDPLVTEVAETIDYTPLLEEIRAASQLSSDALSLLSGFALFFVVVVLCYFSYKLFRIFF